MPDEQCRIARLEERTESHEIQFNCIRDDLADIKTALDNQKGFIRGIAFTITAIVSGAGLIINYWNK